jgi:hypothetical protein
VPPRPIDNAVTNSVSSAISLSRPTRAPAGVTGGMERTLLPQHSSNKQPFFRKLIRLILIECRIFGILKFIVAMQVARTLATHRSAAIFRLKSLPLPKQRQVKEILQFLDRKKFGKVLTYRP